MSPPLPTRPSGRVVFVDLLRLVATFQMVQGHALDAVMAEAHRSGAAFDVWTWTRGLTSVAFLFAAGVSFYLATLLRFDAHRANPRAVRRRFERGALLVVLGYLMHSPLGALGGDAATWAAALREAMIVDVLQCIGWTLIALEALAITLRRRSHVVIVAGLAGVSLIALGPVTATVQPAGVWAPLQSYVTAAGGSLFPLVPWAGYMLAGVAVAAATVPEGSATPRLSSTIRLASAGAALVVLGLLAPDGGAVGAVAACSVRLGSVILATSVLSAASLGIARLPRVLETLAGETLIIYLSHVVVLYAAGVGLADVVGRTVPLPQAVAFAALLVVASAGVGLGWNRLKAARQGRRTLARAVQRG